MYEVVNVIDTNLIEVKPSWTWFEVSGNIVKINGYNIRLNNQVDMQPFIRKLIMKRLRTLLDGKKVKLSNPTSVEQDILICEVYLDDVNIASYFPDYQD